MNRYKRYSDNARFNTLYLFKRFIVGGRLLNVLISV